MGLTPDDAVLRKLEALEVLSSIGDNWPECRRSNGEPSPIICGSGLFDFSTIADVPSRILRREVKLVVVLPKVLQ